MQDAIHHFQGFVDSSMGLTILCILASVCAIACFQRSLVICTTLFRPIIEQGFYNRILNHWLGPFFSKHKIIATFIRLQGLGDAVVDTIACIIGTMFVVAMLSSATTALIISLINDGFVYSLYLICLTASMSMLSWILGFNMRFFYKLLHRLK